MWKTFWLFVLSLPLLAASPKDEIRKVLDDQVAAWNRGDVKAFMEGYWNSDALTFVSSSITKGHARVLANYEKRYPTKENMGTLAFTDLEITPLGKDYASVLGRWHLDRAKEAGGEVGGFFTLLFQRMKDGWKIILDHTS